MTIIDRAIDRSPKLPIRASNSDTTGSDTSNPETSSPDPTSSDTSSSAASKRSVLLLFSGLLLAMMLSSLDQTIFSTALPTIVGELGGVKDMLWVTTAYILASTITLPIYGKLGDLVGRKSLFITAIALFIAGSTVGALASSMTPLIIGRAIQGLGGGGLMILAQAIIADVIPARERARYNGVIGGVFALSSVAGPLLGGYFTEGPGWRWALWINVPLGLLAIASAVLFLRLPKREHSTLRLDPFGMPLLALASAGLVLVSTWGGTTYAWNSPTIIGLIVGTLIAIVAFIRVEVSTEEPIMTLSMFRDRNFTLTTAAGLAIGVAMFGVLAYLPTYLQMVTGVSATKAGLLMTPLMGALLIVSVVSGQFVSKTGRYKWLPVGGSVIVGIALVLLSTMTPSLSLLVVCSYLALLGVGLGATVQLLVLIVQNSFPASQVGTATATNTYFRQIGASLGSAVVGTLFSSRLAHLLSERLGTNQAGDTNSFTPNVVRGLPAATRDVVVSSYNDALTPIFLYLAPLMLVATALLVFVIEKPLATTVDLVEASDSDIVVQPVASLT